MAQWGELWDLALQLSLCVSECVCECMCVFEVLTAVPDEYILNISKISEDEATDPLIIMTIIDYYALYAVYHNNFYHSSYREFLFTKLRQKL